MTEQIQITQPAKDRIKQVIAKKGNEGKFLRLGVDSGGCNGFQYRYFLDNTKNDDDDQFFDDHGNLIAVIDATSKEIVGNLKIDFVEELGSAHFKFSNPNASSSCGCGNSFSV